MIIVDFSVIPVGTGSPSVSEYVAVVQKALQEEGFSPQLHSMGTTVETETLQKALDAVRIGHEAVFKAGALRVVTAVKIDERRDKDGSIQQKLDSVRRRLSQKDE